MYTLSQVVKFTGSKRRSVQLWAEAGAIRADPSTEREGSGFYRRFSHDEVIIACVIAAFAGDNATIGTLIEVGNLMRVSMANQGYREKYVYGAIMDNIKCYLVVAKNDMGFYSPDSADEAYFDNSYLSKMNDDLFMTNVVFLNGCFKQLRNDLGFIRALNPRVAG